MACPGTFGDSSTEPTPRTSPASQNLHFCRTGCVLITSLLQPSWHTASASLTVPRSQGNTPVPLRSPPFATQICNWQGACVPVRPGPHVSRGSSSPGSAPGVQAPSSGSRRYLQAASQLQGEHLLVDRVTISTALHSYKWKENTAKQRQGENLGSSKSRSSQSLLCGRAKLSATLFTHKER